MRTVITIRSGIPGTKAYRKPEDLFSEKEIDRMDASILDGKDRKQLQTLRQKLSDTFDWLEEGDWKIGAPEWQIWERRLDKLNEMMDLADEKLEEYL